MFGIAQEGKHQFLLDLSRNTLRGMLAAAKAGNLCDVPYGYRKAAGKLNIQPDEAAIVARIFAEYVRHPSLRAITGRLNADAIPSPSGRLWGIATVRQILRRQKYIGDYTWGNLPHGKHYHAIGGEIVPCNGHAHAAAPIVNPASHPAIVDADTFERVQQQLGSNRQRTSPYNRSGGGYVFSGMLRCACCGSSMTGKLRTPKHKAPWRQYTCTGYAMGGNGKCTYNSIPEQAIIDAVVHKLQTVCLSPANLDRLRLAIQRRQQNRKPAGDAAKLAKRLAEANRLVEAAADKILAAPQSIATTLYARLEKLQQERDSLRQQWDAAQQPQAEDAARATAEAEAAVDALWRLRDALTAAKGDELRRLLQTAIERIELRFKPLAGTRRTECVGGAVHLRQNVSLVYSGGAE